MAIKHPKRRRTAVEVAPQKNAEANIESLREMASSLLANGNGQQAIESLVDVIASLQKDNQRLVYRLAASARARFGRRSEKLSAEELGQLVLALGGTEEQASAPTPLVPTQPKPTEQGEHETALSEQKAKKRRPNHPGRSVLSPDLQRVIETVTVPAEERACVHCGAEMQCIGNVDHETVEFIPASIVVHIERREKLACVKCCQDIVTAPREKSEAYQRRAGMSLLAHLVESKCDDALPIYRQRDQLRRLGFNIPLNSLYGYWDYATGLLQPVADAIVSKILGERVVGIDDTRLDYLDPASPRGKNRGHLWCFVGDGPNVGFVFTETWEAADIEPWIDAIDGFIQCDDYKGYSSTLVRGDGTERVLVPPDRRLGCLMHVRRRLHQAYVGRHLGAAIPLKLISDIYRIEAQAKERGLSAQDRHTLRQKESVPLLDAFDSWVDENLIKLLPASPLGGAARYAKDQRVFVRRCFSDGRFELDNGRVEREIREPAIGRKNFCFAGSAAAAGRLAAAYTVVQSARRVGVPVREYLIDTLGRLDRGWPARQLTDLLPERWALDRAHASPHEIAEKA